MVIIKIILMGVDTGPQIAVLFFAGEGLCSQEVRKDRMRIQSQGRLTKAPTHDYRESSRRFLNSR